MQLSDSIGMIPGVGPVFQKRLKQIGVESVHDLLFHFPRSYQDLSQTISVGDIRENQDACVKGTLQDIQEQRTFRKRMSITEALLQDTTGSIRIIWFNQPYLITTLHKGEEICCAGRVVRDNKGIVLSNPSYEKLTHGELTHLGRIIPLYPETRGVSSRWLRTIIKSLLSVISLQETLPLSLVSEKKLFPFREALSEIHFPTSFKKTEEAKRRFAFEELFFILLFVLSERKKISSVKAHAILLQESLMKRFTDSLPFRLTDSQKKSAWHILKDMEKPRPMNRLLQGDVGSGKTVVAAMAALSAVKSGCQAVFMAPTEILAKQHFKTASQLLSKFRCTIGLLTGSADQFISPKLPNEAIEISRAKLLKKALAGNIDVFIGTHALIQDKVRFNKLALLVVDEQHRFGVRQRARLLRQPTDSARQAKPLIPHLLSMTATPIPRTLAMTIYGDLDLSIIDEMPKGRKPVITKVVSPQERDSTYTFLRREISEGRQAFVICPRIESQKENGAEVKTVEDEYEKLSKKIFPDLKLAMLHGKMRAREKDEVMKRFRNGKIDVLISTSVVEVGVDIPNASLMLIEGAERFGLAQLHQFRGRIGRGSAQSYCFLFTESAYQKTNARLKMLARSENGFALAEEDLRLRGPGDFKGIKQWGIPDFAMEHLTNLELVEEAREAAKKILERDITLKTYPLLRQKIQELREKLHLE